MYNLMEKATAIVVVRMAMVESMVIMMVWAGGLSVRRARLEVGLVRSRCHRNCIGRRLKSTLSVIRKDERYDRYRMSKKHGRGRA